MLNEILEPALDFYRENLQGMTLRDLVPVLSTIFAVYVAADITRGVSFLRSERSVMDNREYFRDVLNTPGDSPMKRQISKFKGEYAIGMFSGIAREKFRVELEGLVE